MESSHSLSPVPSHVVIRAKRPTIWRLLQFLLVPRPPTPPVSSFEISLFVYIYIHIYLHRKQEPECFSWRNSITRAPKWTAALAIFHHVMLIHPGLLASTAIGLCESWVTSTASSISEFQPPPPLDSHHPQQQPLLFAFHLLYTSSPPSSRLPWALWRMQLTQQSNAHRVSRLCF